LLDDQPRLTLAALQVLRHKGMKQFQQTYGDFYVYGYELGADAGATLNATTKMSSMSETLELTVTVKVLFVKASATFSTSKTSFDSSSAMSFCGYSTLDNHQLAIASVTLSEAEQRALKEAAGCFLDKVQSLEGRARAKLKSMHLEDGQILPLSACVELCQSGLVVQLLLAPFARLEEFVSVAYQS